MPEAIPELIWYALLFFVLAFAFTARKLTKALFGPLISLLQAIPAIGSRLAAPFKAIESAITGACGSIEAGCDRLMGQSWHQTARLLDWTWKEIRRHAHTLAVAAPIIGTLVELYDALRANVHHVTSARSGDAARIKRLEKEYHGIEKELKKLEREFNGIDDTGIGKRLHNLDHRLDVIEGTTIPAIQAADTDAATAISNLWNWVHKNVAIPGTDVFTGAVAVALTALGLGGLRCNSLLSSLKRRGCGLWSGLEDLLGLFVDTLLLTNVCTILPFLETAVSEVADPIVVALTEVGAGLCSGGIGAAPALQTPALHLPANPSVSLNLP